MKTFPDESYRDQAFLKSMILYRKNGKTLSGKFRYFVTIYAKIVPIFFLGSQLNWRRLWFYAVTWVFTSSLFFT